MFTEYDPTINTQVAQSYLDQFSGVADAIRSRPDMGHFESAGVIMATFLKQGANERFQSLVEDLAPNPEYQVGALVNALEYCDFDMLMPVFSAIDTIRPDALSVETRVELMAGVASALLREDGQQEFVEPAWGHYRVPTDELFDEITRQPYVDPSTTSDALHVARFTDIPDSSYYVGYLTAVIDQFVRSPAAERRMDTGFGTVRVGETVVAGTLRGLSVLGFTEHEQRFVDSFAQDPVYGPTVTMHVEQLLGDDKASGVSPYENLQEKRDDIAYMQNLDTEHAKYAARHGDVATALLYAAALPVYQDRVWIMIHAARYLSGNGKRSEAVELLRQAADLDPLVVEPHRSEEEESIDVYEGMPEVDEDDPASIDKFYNEASVRSALYEKSSWELDQELGYTLESIAEAAACIGSFDLALNAFGRSRQYPMQTEMRMAESATELGLMHFYVRAILANETLDEISRPHVLEAALKVFHERADRFNDNGSGLAIQSEVQALVREYAHLRLVDLTAKGRLDNLSLPRIAGLLVQCGDYKEAFDLMKATGSYRAGGVVSAIVQHKAYRGLTAEATALYVHSPQRPTETLSRNDALRAIVHNSLLLGDEASARIALLEIPDNSRRSLMSSVINAIGNTVTQAPEWIVDLALGTEGDERTNIKIIAHAIRRARLITKQPVDSNEA